MLGYVPVGTAIIISWTNPVTFSEIRILRDDVLIANLSGDTEEYTDDDGAPHA